jgi:hypothetical protein
MNITNSGLPAPFDVGAKVTLPMSSIPALVVLVLVYRVSKKKVDDASVIDDQLIYLYHFVSAALYGYIFSLLMPKFDKQYPIAIAVGFFAMLILDKIVFLWRDKEHISYERTILTDIYEEGHIKDRLLEETPANRTGIETASLNNQHYELKSRRILSTFLFLCLIYVTVIDGLFLASTDTNDAVAVVLWYLVTVCKTLVISLSLIHAFFHPHTCCGISFYTIFALVWFIVATLSALPSILEYREIVEEIPGVMIFYAFFVGCLIWYGFYFLQIEKKKTTKRSKIIGLAVFGLTITVVSTICSFI